MILKTSWSITILSENEPVRQGQRQHSHHAVYLLRPVCTGWRWRIGIKIDRPGLCACAAAALTSHTLWCQKLLSYICVTVSTGSSLHQPAVMSSAVKGRIIIIYLFYFYSFTTEQLQHINPGFQYNCQHFDRWQPCRQAENLLHQCVTSSNSALLQESSRWYNVEEREELCQGGGDSAGSRSQPELCQCESLA